MIASVLRRIADSDRTIFFVFFPVLILTGSFALYLPAAYGDPSVNDLSYIDALFTAASAVCVTGLITVDTASYSMFGQWVILALIQIGGLGIISLSTLYLAFPGRKISLKSRKIIRGYYIESIEHEPKRIVRNILLMTVCIEAVGTGILYAAFANDAIDRPVFAALFHAVSAFCNAGFSVFSDNLEGFRNNIPVIATVMVLVVLGGLSFIVLQELPKAVRRRPNTKISLHSKAVLLTTGGLILLGFIGFLSFERGFDVHTALFQSVTPRTAGFNTVPQQDLSDPSRLLTMFLMLVGGAPGSIAGGLKVTTLFLLVVMVFKKPLSDGSIQIMKRTIPGKAISDAAIFLTKAIALVLFSIFALTLTESIVAGSGLSGGVPPTFAELMFESISAFGTVGLSLGITGTLSDPGKLVLVFIMFSGRIGLITMSMPVAKRMVDALIRYPSGEVMIG